MKKPLPVVSMVLGLILAVWGCKDLPTTPLPGDTVKPDPSFSADIQAIFTASCALSNCHGSAAQAGMNLSSGQAYANTVNVPSTQDPSFMRVLPSDAQNSYLVMKIEGRQTSGAKMPASGSLTSNQVQNIKNWVNQGAKDN